MAGTQRITFKPKLKKTKVKYENYIRNENRVKFRSYLKKELEMSTTHGLPYIVKTNIHWCERLFWTASFIFCACLVFVLLSPLYERYKKSPTVTSVEMDYYNWNISYPAITMCPDFKTDEVAFSKLVEEYKNKTGVDLSSYLWSISNANVNTIERIDLQTQDVISMIPAEDYATIAASTFVKFDSQHVTTNTNWPISVQAAMTEMGMCHVINSNVALFNNPFQWRAGSAKYEKSNIELSVHDGEFFIQVMDYADINNIFIHSPDEIVYSNTPSYVHIKESYLSLGVLVSSTRMSEKVKTSTIDFRKCRMTNEPISDRYPVYSYNHCLTECKIRLIFTICGCVPHWYKTLPHEKTCSLLNLSCVIRHRVEFMALAVSEDTLAEFPHAKDLPMSSKDCGCPIDCEGSVYLKDQESMMPHASITRVRIGISTFPKIRVVREEIFGFDDIVLRSGGVVNLCIGSSVISLMEIIMTFIRPIVYITVKLLTRWWRKQTNKTRK